MSRERIDDKIDEAVLGLLYLGIFERDPMMGARTWKSFDWDAMERLHRKGLIGRTSAARPGTTGPTRSARPSR